MDCCGLQKFANFLPSTENTHSPCSFALAYPSRSFNYYDFSEVFFSCLKAVSTCYQWHAGVPLTTHPPGGNGPSLWHLQISTVYILFPATDVRLPA